MDQLNNFQLNIGVGSEIGMAIVLAVMMFAVALALRPHSFSFIRTSPKVYFTGVITQLLLLPLLTLALCFIVSPMPSIALGMILVACCPGGNISNILVLLARGNIALSVSLTATSSIAAAFLTPLSVVFWSSQYPPTANLMQAIDFDVIRFLLQTMLILGLPLLFGMLCVHFFPALSKRIRRPLVGLSTLGLLVIIVGAYVSYFEVFVSVGFALIGLVALHNGLAFLLGNTMARMVSASRAERRTLTYEVGIQNAGLGVVILLSHMNGLGGAAAVAGLWGAWHIVAGLSLVILFRLTDKMFSDTAAEPTRK